MRDVLVAGAGPAGTTVATALAQRGFDVLICDRARFPRATLCGEFLSPESHETLERLGVADAVRALDPVTIDRIRVVAPDRRAVERTLTPAGRGVTRHGLDAALLEHARANGVECWSGCRVTGCVPGANFAVSMLLEGRKHTEHARAVVDATGHARWISRAGVRSGVAGPAPPATRARRRRSGTQLVGIKRHYRLRWPVREDQRWHTLALAPFAGGYLGRAPVEGGVVNVCVLARAEAFMDALGHAYPGIGELLDDLAPVGGFHTTAGLAFGPAPPGLAIAVGDAAGMIAPLAGDGIAMALASGEIAAKAISRHLQGNESWEATCARYRHEWRRAFLGRMRLAGALGRIAARERTANQVVALFEKWPRAIDWLVRGTRGRSRAGAGSRGGGRRAEATRSAP